MLPPIKSFLKNTLLDWEGKIASMVFLPHCNFRCRYCHARRLVLTPDELPTTPLESVLSFVRESDGWIEGVVISGGEPTIHAGLPALLRPLRETGAAIKLDTNGTNPAMLRSLLEAEQLDYVAMDLKAPLNEKYAQIAGAPVDLEAVRESISLLLSGDVDYEFRTTVCPALLDGDDVEAMSKDLAGARLYILQPFRPHECIDEELNGLEPCDLEELTEMAARAAPAVQECRTRGAAA